MISPALHRRADCNARHTKSTRIPNSVKCAHFLRKKTAASTRGGAQEGNSQRTSGSRKREECWNEALSLEAEKITLIQMMTGSHRLSKEPGRDTAFKEQTSAQRSNGNQRAGTHTILREPGTAVRTERGRVVPDQRQRWATRKPLRLVEDETSVLRDGCRARAKKAVACCEQMMIMAHQRC